MKSIAIKASVRTEIGKKAAKSLRSKGVVPGILYGESEPKMFEVSAKTLKSLVNTPNVYLIDLDLDGNKYQAILKDIQFHPVSDEVEHVDFLEISDKKPVVIAVPTKTVGTSKGVLAGGKLTVGKRKLKVKALPSKLPDFIEVDITEIAIGGITKVQDIKFDGLEFLDPKNEVVVAVKATRASVAAATADKK